MLVSFAANIYFVTHNPVADFFSPLTRFWELLTGAFLAYMSVHHRSSLDNVSMRFAHIMSCTGFALLMLGVFYISKENAFPGWWAMLPVYGATLMIAAGPTAILNRLILSNKLVVWFGLISYPLYLWHWPLLAYSLILEGEDRSDITVMLLMAAAVLLAWLTFRFVERPLRYGDGGFKKTLILLSIMAVFCGIGAVVFKKDGFIDRAVSKPYADLYYNPEILHRAKCTGNEIARGLQIDYCALPVDAKGPATSVLLGDSHADDKYNGLVKMDNKRVWMLLGHGSCPPIYGIDIETEQKGCRQKSERAIDWVVDTANINIVALSFLGTTFMDTSYAADHVQRGRGPQVYTMSYEGHPDMSKEDVFYNGLNNAVEKLVAGHKKVILMADVPELPFFPKDCARHNKPCTVDVAAVQERQKKHLDMLRKIAANHKGVSIYNPHALLCNETACGYKVGDVIVYRDSHHLTLKGADLYAEDFLKWLKQQKP